MGKGKKRKKSSSHNSNSGAAATTNAAEDTATAASREPSDANPLLTSQRRFLDSLPPEVRTHFFSDERVAPERRAEVWEAQSDLGESLVNSYAWATPDPRLLKVFRHFGPIVEVGCGANAYWAMWIHKEAGVDVLALDASLDGGGKIGAAEKQSKKAKKKKNKEGDGSGGAGESGLFIRQGGPEALSQDADVRDSGRTLFLCYPDEEDCQPDEHDDEQEDVAPPTSMAAACLEHFTGSTVIHVGELYGDTLSLDQAPFGRSSSSEFQQRLAGEFHCILKMRLNNWLHVRDTLSVWKRSETCCMAFQNDDDDDGGGDGDEEDVEEVYYKHIPPEEVLPVDVAAPCVAHLLDKNDTSAVDDVANGADREPAAEISQDMPAMSNKKRRKKKKKEDAEANAIAGNAW